MQNQHWLTQEPVSLSSLPNSTHSSYMLWKARTSIANYIMDRYSVNVEISIVMLMITLFYSSTLLMSIRKFKDSSSLSMTICLRVHRWLDIVIYWLIKWTLLMAWLFWEMSLCRSISPLMILILGLLDLLEVFIWSQGLPLLKLLCGFLLLF